MPSYKFFLLSPGKVGQAIGKLLLQKNHTCVGLWSRRKESAQKAAEFLQTTPYWGEFLQTGRSSALTAAQDAASSAIIADSDAQQSRPPLYLKIKEAQVILVTPPERYIVSLSQAIAPLLSSGTTLLHTAGSLPPVSLTTGNREQGTGNGGPNGSEQIIHSGVLHPLQSIASAEAGMAVIPGSFMAVSGDDTALQVASELARDLGGTPVQISDPVLYHLGAVMASNTLYPLFAAACSLMERAGVSSELAPKMLLPLVRGSVENIATLGAARGMTGPIARADAATVARHLGALRDDPEIQELYRLIARRALLLAEEAGADARGLQEIATLLEG